MFKVEAGYDNMIQVTPSTEWDSMSGMNIAKVQIEAGQELRNLEANVMTLMADVAAMKLEREQEERLRAEHPGLKDLHNQYKVVLQLVKKNDDIMTEGSN